MSKKNSSILLMALVAMSCFKSTLAFSQTIKTPNTTAEFKETSPTNTQAKPEPQVEESAPAASSSPMSSAPRRLQQHGLGIGLGQTFLFGNYGKYGDDKITADILYTYTASYSFDLLVNAHMSEHKQDNTRMKVMGLTGSIKGRFVEYDNFSPYFLGGLGFYAPKAKRKVDGKNEWSDQKLTFGLNFGGGLDLRLNENYVVGVLGQMHWPFKVEQDEGPNLKGYYFKLLITGMYLF